MKLIQIKKIKLAHAKKASLLTSWAELEAIALSIIGLILALSIRSATLSYIIVIVCGFLAGRMLYQYRKVHKFPSYMIVSGFFLGYIIGSYYTDRRILLFISIVSIVISYYIHRKKLI